MKDDVYKELEKKCREYGVVTPLKGESWESSLEKILALVKVLETKNNTVVKFRKKGWGFDE
jgi:hypothetical protein